MEEDSGEGEEIIIRSANGDLRQSFRVTLNPNKTLTRHQVASLAESEWGWQAEKLRVVHLGRALGELDQANVLDSRVFVVVPHRPFSSVSSPSVSSSLDNDSTEEISANTQRSQRDEREAEEEDDHRQCRICLMGEAESDRLFSPCLCKGSMKYVHVECLNAWRRHTESQTSHFQCEQCHYRYKISRTKVAAALDLLASDQVSFFLAIAIVFSFVALVSFSLHSLRSLSPSPPPSRLILNFFHLNYWPSPLTAQTTPNAVEQGIVEKLLSFPNALRQRGLLALIRGEDELCAFVLVGLTGALVHVSEYLLWMWTLRNHVNWVRQFWENPNTILMGASIASLHQSSTQTMSRSVVVLGLAFCVALAVYKVKDYSKRLFIAFGEVILEVN